MAKPLKKKWVPSTPKPKVFSINVLNKVSILSSFHHLLTCLVLRGFEEVPSIDNEESDGSVHSHIFPTSKAPSTMPPTPIRRKKAQAKKTLSKVAPSISTHVFPNDLEEVFAPHDPERTSYSFSTPCGPLGIRPYLFFNNLWAYF